MRKWLRQAALGLGACILAGCAAQQQSVVTADEAMVLLRSGRQILTCREPCLAEWRRTVPQAIALVRQARWQDLATLVERIGYQDDLSLYYLGLAADRLGYGLAAASFYRQSLQISGTSASCLRLSGECGGIVLPREAKARLTALDRRLAPAPRMGRPARIVIPPAATPSAADSAAGVAAPPAAAAAAEPLPVAAEPAPPPALPGDAGLYIEPPPAPR